jgi:predicted MPP superfamily phosphohydrolase
MLAVWGAGSVFFLTLFVPFLAFVVSYWAFMLFQLGGGRFGTNFVLHCLAWHGSLFLFASAYLMYRQKSNGKPRWRTPTLILAIGCIYFGLAVDALIIEPKWLIVREMTISTPKIIKPITIVFCSDIQADHIGWYERRTLQKIKEQNADLILFGGDYLHPDIHADSQQLVKNWNQLFREADLQAPLGIYAVYGNIGFTREEMFENTAIVLKQQTTTEQIGEIRVTFLSFDDSWTKNPVPDTDGKAKFRIIVGHSPRYAMAAQEADLLLAGHTHGGQVQVPGWGPLVTASGDFPKKWASGMTPLPNGPTLIVSHGSGLERGIAPRVRFYCRPDIWVIRLVPQ